MKKLFLLPLVAIGLALVPAKRADAQVSIGVGGVGIGDGYPRTDTATTDTRDTIMVITRGAITATTVVAILNPNVLLWQAVLLQRQSGLPTPQASSLLPLVTAR